MRLATRTGVAAMAAALLAVVSVSALVVFQFQRSLSVRVDQDLRERAEAAAILVAVGDRIEASELNPTLNGARVTSDTGESTFGRLPSSSLPPITSPGLRTVSVDGEQWRVLTVEVRDVPTSGDRATVDLVAPLGDVNTQVRQLRRRSIVVGFLVAVGSGLVGTLLGRRAAAPLSALRNDAARIGTSPQADWAVRPAYGAPEVDDVARAFNTSLNRLADATERREAALAAARSFAAAASHELRTPLQAAMAELDLALTSTASATQEPAQRRSIVSARGQLDRMTSSLSAVRALTEVDLVDPTWFVEADLSDLADQAVAALSPGDVGGATISFVGDEASRCRVWPDGVTLALENVIRNALRHARPPNGTPLTVTLTIDAERPCVAVDDNGPGIPIDERERLLLPFERGTTTAGGSGLGLAFAARVVAVHGGRLSIDDGPLGGTRVSLCFGPEV